MDEKTRPLASTKQILKITTLFSGVQGLNILLNLVRTKLAALLLGPAGTGLNSIYNEMRELIHTTTNMGMDVSSVRELSQAYEDGDIEKVREAVGLTRSWVMLLALVGMLICLVLAEPLSWLTFSDFSHASAYALLSPAIAFSTLACGEMAILKGTRRLRALAVISVVNVIAGIVTTIPLYYIWGMAGIVPALVLLTLALYVIVIAYSFRIYPLRLCFKAVSLRKGFPMLVVGTSFVLTGLVSHGTELAIRTYLNNVASLETVGLYAAGFTIVMTYGGMIFASLDNDYFPRLSGIFQDAEKRQETMNKQISVLLMLVIPLAIVLMLVLPVAVPLLFSSEFNAVIPMAQAATLALLYRAAYLPAAYMPLAAGDSRSFLCLETVSYIIVLACVITGYQLYGLMGTGIALAVSNLMDMIVNLLFVRLKYDVRVTKKIVFSLIISTLLLSIAVALCLRYL